LIDTYNRQPRSIATELYESQRANEETGVFQPSSAIDEVRDGLIRTVDNGGRGGEQLRVYNSREPMNQQIGMGIGAPLPDTLFNRF
jgi:hypothetical protein